MNAKARQFIEAMRVPVDLEAQVFGAWKIERVDHKSTPVERWSRFVSRAGFSSMAILWRHGEVVMEDSRTELSRHLPACFAARGRVLVTGLGLGCVVRGLLANESVEHIDVVEIDCDIIERVWPHVGAGDRGTVHHLDANQLADKLTGRWDVAWHDLHLDEGSLALEHARLMAGLVDRVGVQGAWGWDRPTRRKLRRRAPGILGVGG